MKVAKTSFLTALISIIFTTVLLSQVEGVKLSKNHYREYGFSSTSVLRYLSSFDERPNTTNFSLTIRRHKKGKKGATRWIFDLNTRENFGTEFVSLGVAWGKEYHRNLINRWTVYSGFDLSLLGMDSFIQGNDFDFIFGTAPTFGIRFKINSLIYISTEGAINIQFGTASGVKGFAVATAIPNILHLNFRFSK